MFRESRAKWPTNVKNKTTPNLNLKIKKNEVAITFINHATFSIQLNGIYILTDPIWSDRASPISWVGPKRVRKPGVKFEELPKIDLILISHNHYDHLDIDTLKKLDKRFSPKVFVPIGDKDLINSIGIKNVLEFDWWDSSTVNSDTIVSFTPTQHGSARGLFDQNKSLWGSYYIKQGDRSIYFGGDAGYSTHYLEIYKRLGAPDIAILGIGAYRPRWFMKPIHMNPSEAIIAHKDLKAAVSIGMHFGTFQMSSESIDQPKADLVKYLEKEGVDKNRFITLNEGETRLFTSIDLEKSRTK